MILEIMGIFDIVCLKDSATYPVLKEKYIFKEGIWLLLIFV